MSNQKEMFDDQHATQNPGLYRELSVPFPGPEAANAALSAFCADLYELRAKHRIQDIMFVIQANVAYGNEEGDVMSCAHFGSEEKAENMAAYALGFLQAQRQERTATTLARAAKAISKQQHRK